MMEGRARGDLEGRRGRKNHESLRGGGGMASPDGPGEVPTLSAQPESPFLSQEACDLTQHPRRTAYTNSLDFFVLTSWDILRLFLQDGSLGVLRRQYFISSDIL